MNEMRADGGDTLTLPKPVRVALVALALVVIAVAGFSRLTGRGHITVPGAVAVETRALRFVDRESGAIGIYDATTGAAVAELAPGTGGFVRGSLRSLARVRRTRGIGDGVPFHLTRWRDGRLTLDDSTTASRVELAAFGPTNAAAFAALLSSSPARAR